MSCFKKASDIKVGVIGYGGSYNMGKIHMEQMQHAGMTPSAVAELDPERLKVASSDFPGIATFNSVAGMLAKSDVNLVTIITPHNTHAKLALQCLRAGRHVVCEKPFAITTEECDVMIREAKRRGLLLSTYHNRHWDGWILEAVQHICREQVIGKVVRIDAHLGGYGQPGNIWRSSKSISGGILYDWGVHFLEYCLQIIDADIMEVSGFATHGVWAPKTVWKQDTNEDEACAVVRFRNGSYLTLRMSSIEVNPKKGWLEITGTKGTYIMDAQTYEIITRKGKQTVTIRGQSCDTLWDKFYQNIADHLVKRTPLVITAEWARRPIHIIDLACRSAKQGCALKARYH